MGRKGGRGRGRMRNYAKVRVSPAIEVLAMLNQAAEATNMTATMTSSGRVTSVEGTWSIDNLVAGEGPVHVGVCHPDYSDSEIAEAILVQVTGPNALVEMERANRKVRIVGTFSAQVGNRVLNDGKPIKTKLNWAFEDDGVALAMFIFNDAQQTLTTGAFVFFEGHLNVFWT